MSGAVAGSVRDLADAGYRLRTTCRGCDSQGLVPVLDLGSQPLANGFRWPTNTDPEPRYPLHLVRCPACELVQITTVVDPQILYGQRYPYRSGVSAGWALHCHALAKEIGADKRVLEIGCLDGVMLRHCRDNGCEVQGVDPSSPVTDLPIIRELFGRGWWCPPLNRFDVIVAQNVFGHVDDARGFLEGVKDYLAPAGVCIIECPWVVDLIDGVRWDTVYHEHLSYWGLRPLMRLAEKVGLHVRKIKYFQDLHGGTMRYYLGVSPVFPSEDFAHISGTWNDEEMDEIDWKRFREKARGQINGWSQWFACNTGKRVGAYGASAKLNTFLNALSVFPALTVVLDDCPEKVGLLTPGLHYPVTQPSETWMKALDVLLVGSSNLKKELEGFARLLGFTGEVKTLWG